MTTIYHNPRCAKSRETLQLLHEHDSAPHVIEYLSEPPTKKQLRDICKMLGLKPLQIIRTKEALFSELELSTDNGYSDDQWLDVLVKNPRLLERPIVVRDGRAILGRPPENVHQLFAKKA